MFIIIQLTKFIPMLDFYMPAEVEMYYGEVRKTIDFEILSPDGLIAALSGGKHNMTTLMDLYMNDAESSENQTISEGAVNDTPVEELATGGTHTESQDLKSTVCHTT